MRPARDPPNNPAPASGRRSPRVPRRRGPETTLCRFRATARSYRNGSLPLTGARPNARMSPFDSTTTRGVRSKGARGSTATPPPPKVGSSAPSVLSRRRRNVELIWSSLVVATTMIFPSGATTTDAVNVPVSIPRGKNPTQGADGEPKSGRHRDADRAESRTPTRGPLQRLHRAERGVPVPRPPARIGAWPAGRSAHGSSQRRNGPS